MNIHKGKGLPLSCQYLYCPEYVVYFLCLLHIFNCSSDYRNISITGPGRGARYYWYTGISRFRSPEIRIAICF